MKTMTSKQLGGAFGKAFHVNSFEEIADMSKSHGIEMLKIKDPAHRKAMDEMQVLMKNETEMKNWFEDKCLQFDALPED